jgi:hypothetical protein
MTYRHAISLGPHCYAAGLLHRAGLRRFSGPFDWIFASAPMVRHCLQDDFATLLDRHHFEPVPIEQRPDPLYYRCQHRFYQLEFGVNYVFNHHDVWTDEGYAYLRRCVLRFRQAIASGPVLLAQARWDHMWNAASEFEQTVACLTDLGISAGLNAFTVDTRPTPDEVPGVVPLAKIGPHALYRVRRTEQWLATEFKDPADEQPLIEVLCRHSFDPLDIGELGPD